ncbi:MAG: PEP-utilizing enzyme [Candidatus Micrarchaeota archaeon]
MKTEHWFTWEREATIHPILMCMEAWIEPMAKAYARPWPTTIIIYNGDIVSWYNPWVELLDYGDFLIKRFSKPDEQKALVEQIERYAKEIVNMFREFEEIDLSDLSAKEILPIYNILHKNYVNWFIPGGLVEPIGHQGEKLVRKLLENLDETEKNDSFTILTSATKESFSRRELKELLEIAIVKKEGKDVSKLLQLHAKKYFWTHNNYFVTEVLDKKFFEKEFELVIAKYSDPKQEIIRMDEELKKVQKDKEELLGKLKIDQDGRNLIELLNLFSWYQDYRKEITMQMLHYLDWVLEEIGARNEISLKEMKYTMATEIPALLEGNFDKDVLKERMKRFLFYYDYKENKIESGTGEWSVKKEKEIFQSLKHEDEILELSGMVASRGFVRGIARVAMSASYATNILPGEILISSMTTPDFVTSMKRAAAIVTNEGGILCHAAVIAREFGLPCIVGTKLATKVFKTGDLIEVDGELGVVRKIK